MDLARKQRVTYLVCLAAAAAFALQAIGDTVRGQTLWIEGAWLCAIGTASFAFSIYLTIVHKALN